MPVTYSILPQRNLAVFTYWGEVKLCEPAAVVAAATAHPSYCDGMRQLCDVSRVTAVEHDAPALLKLHAHLADSLLARPHELVVVFYAPTQVGQEIAEMARRSWDGVSSVIVLVMVDEAEALAVLGLPETSLEALMACSAQ